MRLIPQRMTITIWAAFILVFALLVGGGCRNGSETCGQDVITGDAGPKTYTTENECVNDRANQQTIAEADGKKKCTDFCTGKGKGCVPMPEPKPPKATPACKQEDDGKWHTQVKTGPFDCICKKSS
jgi:hypothetical protein